MNLYEFVKKVLTTAKKHKLVNRVAQGDVYQIMNSGKQVYGSVVLTINNITKNIDEDTRTINGYLYYIDRTTDTQDNALSIQSTAVEVLGQVFMAILEGENWDLESSVTTVFTEKFGDLCAGAYTTFDISLPIDDICVDENAIEKLIKEINGNGTYDVRDYDEVNVQVEPKLQESFVNITENGQHYAFPEEGYEGLYYAIIDVNVSATATQTKSVNIFENGSTTIIPDEGYNLSQVDVNVNLPITDKQVVTYTANGSYTIEPMTGDTALKIANVTVDVNPSLQEKIITANGTYTADEGYYGLNSVNVNLPITDKQVVTYTKNGDYTIEPMTGDTALKIANVTVDVNPSLQEKIITANGTYTADEGYYGLNSVTVDVPSDSKPEQEKTVELTELWKTYEITPDDGYVLSKVNATTNIDVYALLEGKEVEITQNGEEYIHPTSADMIGLSYVKVTTNVPTITTLTMTQEEYDALETKDANTIYLTTL